MNPGKPVGLSEAISCSRYQGILPWQNHGKTQVHPSKRQRTWAGGKALEDAIGGLNLPLLSPDCIKAPPENQSPLKCGAILPLIVARFPANPAVNKDEKSGKIEDR